MLTILKFIFPKKPVSQPRQRRRGLNWRGWGIGIFLFSFCLTLGLPRALAQLPSSPSELSPSRQETTVPAPKATVQSYPLPTTDNQPEPTALTVGAIATPTLATSNSPAETATSSYDYRLAFNRDPAIGNRIRLEGVYSETGVYFTRPQQWQLNSAKVRVKFQHSPSLRPEQSHLVVRLNDTSVGSVALDRPESEIGQALFNLPLNLIQDQNVLTLSVEQHISETCTNPGNPALWTEILPDSEFLFQFTSQDFALDFSEYPYPFFDPFSLDPTRLAYLQPQTISDEWLTASARFQASIGRLADYRPMHTRLVKAAEGLDWSERLIVIGTPKEQPILKNLALPFALNDDQLVDGSQKTLPGDVGILALTATPQRGIPVLVVTGNSPAGVQKAVQFLSQPQNQPLSTGKAILVEAVPDMASPDPRDWPDYVPMADDFLLSDLTNADGLLWEDTTVRGTHTGPISIDFRALPDDRFSRDSAFTIHYSHSPLINPRTSSIEVRLDDIAIGAKPLSSRKHDNQTLAVTLPPHLIKPNSRLDVQFVMHPKDAGACGIQADKQLWGTLHGDSSFHLNRDNIVKIPDLKLFQTGYPLTAPQDLSKAAIALPDDPTVPEIQTLLALSGRLGQVSKSPDIKLAVYQTSSIPGEQRSQRHWVGIGSRARFPFSEAFTAESLGLMQQFTRQWQGTQIQSIRDQDGIIKTVLSPWNQEHILVALTAQTDVGLQQVQDALTLDPLFFALEGDTALISRKTENPSPYSKKDYSLRFLKESPSRQIVKTGVLRRSSLFLENHWLMLPTISVLLVLVLYSISQLYLNRISDSRES